MDTTPFEFIAAKLDQALNIVGFGWVVMYFCLPMITFSMVGFTIHKNMLNSKARKDAKEKQDKLDKQAEEARKNTVEYKIDTFIDNTKNQHEKPTSLNLTFGESGEIDKREEGSKGVTDN